MTKTRKTIGVMVGGITDDFTRFLCKGLREAAKEQDVNMVVLPGKFLDRDYAQNTDIMYEYQYDTLFSSVQKEKGICEEKIIIQNKGKRNSPGGGVQPPYINTTKEKSSW